MYVISGRDDYRYVKLNIFLVLYMCLISNLQIAPLSIGVIILALGFFNKPEYLLPSVLISSLLGDHFVAFAGMGMSRITVIAYILICAFKNIRGDFSFSRKSVIYVYGACAFCFFSSWLSLTGQLKPAITMILNLVMLLFMCFNRVRNVELFFENIKYSIWIFSAYIFLLVISGWRVIYVEERLTLDGANSNVLGMCLAQLIIFLLTIMVSESNKKFIFIDFLFIVLDFYVLLLTGSRSALIATGVVVVLFLLKKIAEHEHMFRNVLLLIGGACAIIVAYKLIKMYNPILLARFTIEDVMRDGGSGRRDIWEAMLTYVIPYNLLFGVGLGGGNTIVAMAPYVFEALGVHNLYLTVLAQVGIVGSVMFYAFWIRCFFSAMKYGKNIINIHIPLYMIFTAFVNGIGEEVFSERYLWFCAGLVFMLIYNAKFVRFQEAVQ